MRHHLISAGALALAAFGSPAVAEHWTTVAGEGAGPKYAVDDDSIRVQDGLVFSTVRATGRAGAFKNAPSADREIQFRADHCLDKTAVLVRVIDKRGGKVVKDVTRPARDRRYDKRAPGADDEVGVYACTHSAGKWPALTAVLSVDPFSSDWRRLGSDKAAGFAGILWLPKSIRRQGDYATIILRQDYLSPTISPNGAPVSSVVEEMIFSCSKSELVILSLDDYDAARKVVYSENHKAAEARPIAIGRGSAAEVVEQLACRAPATAPA